ncbi:MAG: FKBP-type peptidyl-prolyl cis-trans isomerase [Planctomycetota bacterium]
MKPQNFLLLFALILAAPLMAQSDSKPQSRPTEPTSRPAKKLTPRELKLMQTRDLVVPEMKNPIEEKNGVKWCYIRRAKAKMPLLRIGDIAKVHITLWDQKDQREIMTTRRRAGRGHGLGAINVGVSLVGLDMVLPKLRIGDKVRIDVPSASAFGEVGVPQVGPNTDLIYSISIHEIEKHVDIPKPGEFDEKKAIKITEAKSYVILKDGKGPIAGDHGIVVYDFLATNENGRIVDYSLLRDYAIMGGEASKCIPSYLRLFSPVARVGTEFIVRIDFDGVPVSERPFAMANARYCYMQLLTRWVIPFEPSTKKMKTAESGLQYEIINPGEGKQIKPTHHVTMHYAWWRADGHLIESSYARGTTNTLRQVALPKGMVEGLNLIRPGGKIRMKVPSELAWGDRARKDLPANSDVFMLVELFKSEQLDPLVKPADPKGAKKSEKK